jgi:transcriptional regulator with XRE-family HTH domain
MRTGTYCPFSWGDLTHKKAPGHHPGHHFADLGSGHSRLAIIPGERLGAIVSISHASISRIETGAQPYSQPILEGIAGALDTDPASLLSRDPSDHEAIWSIWDKAQPFEREPIVNMATAILKTRKDA